jgi:serine/threonine-protein kinase
VSIAPNTIIDHYEVLSLIGAGAMGEVFLAVDRELARKVALKILSDTHRDNRELRARFVREARAVAAVSHPNVVQVFTTGEYDGRPYFAMEYLAGKDLGTLVREKGAMSSRTVAGVLLDAARGLEAAAQAGLIHRDVKPSNLVRLDSGPVKVTDFGLVKPIVSTGDPALTALGVVVGTPDYIAPEQARGEEIDFRVDVYSLGCTAFYLLVGRPPFRRGNDDEDKYLKVVARHLKEPAPDSRRLAADVDDDLGGLALRMMDKSPAARPSYVDLIEELEQVRARLLSATAGRPPTVPVTTSTSKPSRRMETKPLPAPASSPPPQRIWLWALTALSVLAFLVGVGVTAVDLIRQPERSAAAATSVDARPVVVVTPPPLQRPDAGVVSALAAPDGMIVVRDPNGQAQFFVDRLPVSHRQFAAFVKSHKIPSGEADRPVTSVSFDAARGYARQRGKRLLRIDEWQSALDTLGFVPAGMRTWEWVDDGVAKPKTRPVRRVNDGREQRKPAGDKTTTFRLAQDLS